MNELEKYTEKTFEDRWKWSRIWYARELQIILKYSQWRRFNEVIEKIKIACTNNDYNVVDHFAGVGKMIEIAKKAKRKVLDYKLSRYACYLISTKLRST